MGARSELSTTVGVLSRNQVLFVAALVSAVAGVIATAMQFLGPAELIPILSFATSGLFLFVTPFIEGGLYGMADEGLRGRTSLGTFLASGKSNYLRLLGGRFLLLGVLLGIYVAVVVLAVIVVFGLGAVGIATGGLGDVGPAFLVIVLLLVAVLAVAVLTPLFFLQFYAPAIVVNGRGIVAAFKESYRLARENTASVLGYDAVLVALSVLGGLPYWVLLTLRFDGAEGGAAYPPFAGISPSAAAGFVVATLVIGVPVTAFTSTYQVAFFVDRVGE